MYIFTYIHTCVHTIHSHTLQDAKTESAQQAINKLNSLKMFFDQFPSMRVADTPSVCYWPISQESMCVCRRFDE